MTWSTRLASVLVPALLAGLIPLAAASHDGGTPVAPATLYFHASGSEPWAVNTQSPPPDVRWHAPGEATLTCGGLPPPAPRRDGHAVVAYSTPALVDYEAGGVPRVHPERGLGLDVQVDLATPWTITWYLATPPAGASGQSLPAPEVGVRVEVRAPVDAVPDTEGFAAGSLLAHGVAEPRTLRPAAPGHSTAADGTHVYAFEVVLEKDAATIPRATGFEVLVQPFTQTPCPDGTVVPPHVGSFSDADHRPRMVLGVLEPLRAQLHAEVVGDDVVVHLLAQSAWGLYDVDAASAALTATGPGPAALERDAVPQPAALDPGILSWTWRGGATAQPGTYTFGATVANLQATSQAHAVASLDVGKGRGTPGPEAATLAVLATVAAFLSTRKGDRGQG